MNAEELTLAVVDRAGGRRTLHGRAGEMLMPRLRDEIDVTIGTCGGALSCGTCLVLLDESSAGRLPPPSGDEAEMLEALGAEPGARLACQIELSPSLGGLTLTIAPEL